MPVVNPLNLGRTLPVSRCRRGKTFASDIRQLRTVVPGSVANDRSV